MINDTILIITNNKEKGSQISSKIKLLRENDIIKTVSYIECISILNTNKPSLMLLYSEENDSIEIIKEIRGIKNLDNVPIILITDEINEEKLFYAFDNGIDDFLFLNEKDSVILMRILLAIQKSILYKQIEMKQDILITDNVIDKETGLYTKEKAAIVFRKYFSRSMEEDNTNTVFVYIKPVAAGNTLLNNKKISNIIKAIPRGNDIGAYAKESGYYLILFNAGESGANSVVSRIQKEAGENCIIYASAAEINVSFEELEAILYRSIKEQIANEEPYKFIKNIDIKKINSDEITDENGKSFKAFKTDFLNNFEKIVAPIFYQIQNTATEKYKQALISYYINENESIFSIKQNKHKAELKITYPSYIKVIIDIKQIKEEKITDIKRLTYDIEEFSQEILNMLLEDMLNEYSMNLSFISIREESGNEL